MLKLRELIKLSNLNNFQLFARNIEGNISHQTLRSSCVAKNLMSHTFSVKFRVSEENFSETIRCIGLKCSEIMWTKIRLYPEEIKSKGCAKLWGQTSCSMRDVQMTNEWIISFQLPWAIKEYNSREVVLLRFLLPRDDDVGHSHGVTNRLNTALCLFRNIVEIEDFAQRTAILVSNVPSFAWGWLSNVLGGRMMVKKNPTPAPSVHIKPRWLPVARYEKKGDCKQSMLPFKW